MGEATGQLAKLIFVGAGVLGWVLLFRILFAAREGIRWGIQALVFGVLAYVFVTGILLSMHLNRQQAGMGGIGGAVIAVAATPKRSRYLPAHVKRRVIAKYERNTGKLYNSRDVEIDHRWPFSRGGSSTVDNLRVINKADNRRKGARKPTLRDWF